MKNRIDIEHGILMSGPMVVASLQDRKTMTRRVRGLERVNDFPDNWFVSSVGILDLLGHKHQDKYGAFFRRHDTPEFCEFIPAPYGEPGDRLWVRETWATSRYMDLRPPSDTNNHGLPFWYAANNTVRYTGSLVGGVEFMSRGKWRPSIHMPRWASRITNEIVRIKPPERVSEISTEDAIKEGIFLNQHGVWQWTNDSGVGGADPVGAFRLLWNSINAKWKGVYHRRKLIAYVCYPWNEDDVPTVPKYVDKNNIPCRAYPNPYVWPIEFKRVMP